MNLILFMILLIITLKFILNFAVEKLNVKNITPVIPQEFKGMYAQEKYEKSQSYLIDNTNLGLIEEVIQYILLVGFILFGGFNAIDQIIRQLGMSEILSGVLYIFVLLVLSFLIGLPFNMYDTFVIEERYGFNKTTMKIFITDILKNFLLMLLIGFPVLALILWFFEKTGVWAPLYIWVFVVLFQIFMMFVSPVLILPLFNKFIPLEDGELKNKIEEYARKENFKMKGIYYMDGSKRSTKSNAFFTGFGKFKRIVLFDTLIKNHSSDELLTILAHEMGHYKMKHIIKMVFSSILEIGLTLMLLFLFLKNESIFEAFSMKHISIYASLVLFGFVYIPVSIFLSILTNYFSRRMEKSADEFAVKTTGKKEIFIETMKKLSVNNLSNLTPHRLKVFLSYSHPPILERIKQIRDLD